MFVVFGKCPFLLRWKNVVSVPHPLHLCFSRNKSVTGMVMSVNRPFIMRHISGKRAFLPRYISSIHAVIAWLLFRVGNRPVNMSIDQTSGQYRF